MSIADALGPDWDAACDADQREDPWRALAAEVWSRLPDNASRDETIGMYARELADEYERGRQHSRDDLAMSQRHCRALQQALDGERRRNAKLNMQIHSAT